MKKMVLTRQLKLDTRTQFLCLIHRFEEGISQKEILTKK